MVFVEQPLALLRSDKDRVWVVCESLFRVNSQQHSGNTFRNTQYRLIQDTTELYMTLQNTTKQWSTVQLMQT